MTLQPFEKWVIDFLGPIKPQGKMGACYTINATESLTRWVKSQPVKDCAAATAAKFLFDSVLTWFGCPKILMSDHGTHFLRKTISALTKEFQVCHQQSTPYHPQASRIVQAFNAILETALTKVCNTQWNDWDLCIPFVLWAYKTTCKKLMGQTPLRLVYGTKAVMPMEYIIPRLWIAAMTGMSDHEALEERLAQLEELEEEQFLVGFHRQV